MAGDRRDDLDGRSLAVLAHADPDDSDAPDAEMCLRRIANRHGHDRRVIAGALIEYCPDPAAHQRDVADLRQALEAAGLLGYEPAPAPKSARRYGQGRTGGGGPR